MVLYYKVNFISLETPVMVQEETGCGESRVDWCMNFLLFFRLKVVGTKILAQVSYLYFKEMCRRTKIISLKT